MESRRKRSSRPLLRKALIPVLIVLFLYVAGSAYIYHELLALLVQGSSKSPAHEDLFAELESRGWIDPARRTDYRQVEILPYDRSTSVTMPPEIASAQALADIDTLEYLLDNAYSGKGIQETLHGVDFMVAFSSLRLYARQNDSLQTRDFEDRIAELFAGIVDGHFAISGHVRHSFSRHLDAYFADLVLRKAGASYVVVDSRVDGIGEGSVLTQADKEQCLFRTLSGTDAEYYLVGTLSRESVGTLRLSFDDRVRDVPLHPCRLSRYQTPPSPPRAEVRDSSAVVTISVFSGTDGKAMTDAAKMARNTSTLTVNLLNNQGGTDRYVQAFYAELSDKSTSIPSVARTLVTLVTPVTLQPDLDGALSGGSAALRMVSFLPAWLIENQMRSNPQRKWIVRSTSELVGSSYDGQMIVLQNRRVASSAESFVKWAEVVKKHIVVGENSAGIINIGAAVRYVLPHSRIRVQLPHKLFFWSEDPGALEESTGIMPDYWIDAVDPLGEIQRWIEHRATYQPCLY